MSKSAQEQAAKHLIAFVEEKIGIISDHYAIIIEHKPKHPLYGGVLIVTATE